MLPTRLRLLRQVSGLSASEFAAECGIDVQALYPAENGLHSLGLQRVAAKLGVSAEALLERTASVELPDDAMKVPPPPDLTLLLRTAAEDKQEKK